MPKGIIGRDYDVLAKLSSVRFCSSYYILCHALDCVRVCVEQGPQNSRGILF